MAKSKHRQSPRAADSPTANLQQPKRDSVISLEAFHFDRPSDFIRFNIPFTKPKGIVNLI
ncbi:hypothetical protein Barb4_03160 [Bacteroidales bacterium Barb4]|nr:hypothetical protein Barb4_03160 [Bacteroidales bacterium Barb4]